MSLKCCSHFTYQIGPGCWTLCQVILLIDHAGSIELDYHAIHSLISLSHCYLWSRLSYSYSASYNIRIIPMGNWLKRSPVLRNYSCWSKCTATSYIWGCVFSWYDIHSWLRPSQVSQDHWSPLCFAQQHPWIQLILARVRAWRRLSKRYAGIYFGALTSPMSRIFCRETISGTLMSKNIQLRFWKLAPTILQTRFLSKLGNYLWILSCV